MTSATWNVTALLSPLSVLIVILFPLWFATKLPLAARYKYVLRWTREWSNLVCGGENGRGTTSTTPESTMMFTVLPHVAHPAAMVLHVHDALDNVGYAPISPWLVVVGHAIIIPVSGGTRRLSIESIGFPWLLVPLGVERSCAR